MIPPEFQADTSEPSSAEIREQVQIIFRSPSFYEAERGRAILGYIMETTLNGNPATEKSIAATIYGKNPKTFDSVSDGLVRVEVSKLRKRLSKFYESDGATAPVAFRIEKYRLIAEYTPYRVSTGLSVQRSRPNPMTETQVRALIALEKKHRAESSRLSERVRILNWSLKDLANILRKAKQSPLISVAEPVEFDAEAARMVVTGAAAKIADMFGLAPEQITVFTAVASGGGSIIVCADVTVAGDSASILALVDATPYARLLPLEADGRRWTKGPDGQVRLA